MRERPILFSAPMVRAILDGSKTQTRRIVTPQGSEMQREVMPDGRTIGWRTNVRHAHGWTTVNICPYGAPGDRLWIKEAFRVCFVGACCFGEYAAGGERLHSDGFDTEQAARFLRKGSAWSPAIHMPRWASRLTLDVAGVRVERLQEITADDAVREGINPSEVPGVGSDHALVDAFQKLWDSINGKHSPWSSNPWVWVVSFRRLVLT